MSKKNNKSQDNKKFGLAELFNRKSPEQGTDSMTLEDSNNIPDTQQVPEQDYEQYQIDVGTTASDDQGMVVEKAQINIGNAEEFSDSVANVDGESGENGGAKMTMSQKLDMLFEEALPEDKGTSFQENVKDAQPENNDTDVAFESNAQNEPDVKGDTVVFDAAKSFSDKNGHDELDLAELEESARDYFNANHTSSIDDKINELRSRADEGFDDELAVQDAEQESENVAYEQQLEETEPQQVVQDEPVKEEKPKKKKKHLISNDDIELLTAMDKSSSTGAKEGDDMINALGGKDSTADYSDYFNNDEPDVEYTDSLQEPGIIKELRSKTVKCLVSVLLTIVLTVLCCYFEVAHGTSMPHPSFFETGRYGVVYALSMLQLMFFGVMLNLDGVIRAFKGLAPKNARPEGLAAMAIVMCTFHTVCSLIFEPKSTALESYCTVGCLALVMLSINSFVKTYTTLTSFCIVASKKAKFSTTELDASSGEAKAFDQYLDKDTKVFTVSKNSFVSGFFKKTFATPKVTKGSYKLVIVGLIVGTVVGALKGWFSADPYTGITAGVCVVFASLPVNLMLATALPHLLFSLRAANYKTAFVGEAASDAYTQAGVLSFDDTEVFPPKSVKVSSIRTYGDTRIDKTIIYMARIFGKLGGPLSFVFANSIQGNDESVGQPQILEQSNDGFKVKLDEMEILIGNSKFFAIYDITTPNDNIDESFVQSLGSIMYMAVDGELSAKFYIRYTVNPGFEKILRSMYNAGVCAGIKTFDPCINDDLVCGCLKNTNYPISVIKKTYTPEEENAEKVSVGSLVSLAGTHSFLRGFISLDKLRNVYRLNKIFGIISAVLGILATSALVLLGSVAQFGGVTFFLVFQLIWCVPTIIFSAVNK